MTIEPSDTILAKSHTTAQEVKLQIAIALFKEEIFTLGQAALLAELPQLIFQQELAKRKIAVHYDVEELRQDLQHLKVA